MGTVHQFKTIGSKADIQKWVAAYRENGISELCTTHGTYTGESCTIQDSILISCLTSIFV